VCGGAQDADPAGGVLDYRQDVQLGPGQGCRLEEVAGQQCVGLGAQELRPRAAGALGCGVDTGLVEDLLHGGGRDFDAENQKFAV
jgi:hypothetical protein